MTYIFYQRRIAGVGISMPKELAVATSNFLPAQISIKNRYLGKTDHAINVINNSLPHHPAEAVAATIRYF